MTTMNDSFFHARKTLVAMAVGMSFVGSAIAQEEPKTISLIKKPISLIKNKKQKIKKTTKQAVEPLLYSDIARVLNQLPGIFAIHRMPNDPNPLISHHSDLLTHDVSLISDNLNWNALPYYLSGRKNITPVLFSGEHNVQSLDYMALPSSTVASIVGNGPQIADSANLALTLGSLNQRGLVLDHGSEKANFGHRLYVNKRMQDSHRQFSNGDKGEFDANEVLLKMHEISRVNNGKNNQITQLMLHYKDYQNDESYIGISGDDVNERPRYRYSATRGDYTSGDDLLLGIRHQTSLLAGEKITTDVYYRRGDIKNYQTDGIGDFGINFVAPVLSIYEDNPVGNQLINKSLVESSFVSSGFKMDMEQQRGAHQLNLGFSYQNEELEQAVLVDNYLLSPDLLLTKQSSTDDVENSEFEARINTFYLTDTWRSGRWDVNAGVRWVKFDDFILDVDESTFGREDDKHTLFNLKLGYQFSSAVYGFIGARQGVSGDISVYSPQLAKLNNQAVIGLSYRTTAGYLSLKGYYREFDNALTRCAVSKECAAMTQDSTDIEVSALELSGGYSAQFDDFELPMSFNYSYRDGLYTQQAQQLNLGLSANDELTYLPKQQLSAKFGVKLEQLYIGARVQYRSELRVSPGQAELTNANSHGAVTVVDFTASYQLSDSQRISLAVENALDEEYVEHSMFSGSLIARNRVASLTYQYQF
ncbi:TonB-dependent receptor domain-containing protein [Psychrobium sp. nBUS_13]|uniref:TonB-dependent receptor domain-containing protein n=1 Tax=Psychrobium sp. nBUS_13 TaxID=3395319 RepID=UPI003EBD8B59